MNKKLFLEDDRFLDFITGLAFFEKHVEEWINQCHSGTINVKEAQDDFKNSIDGLEKKLSFNDSSIQRRLTVWYLQAGHSC